MYTPVTLGHLVASGAGPAYVNTLRNQATGRPAKMEGTVFVSGGTWGSGTMALQVSNGIGWANIPNASLTADGMFTFSIHGQQIRINLTGATNPDITAYLNSDQDYVPAA